MANAAATSSVGVVVITSALHAVGHGFETHTEYFSSTAQKIKNHRAQRADNSRIFVVHGTGAHATVMLEAVENANANYVATES